MAIKTAQHLRKRMTDAERKLWARLRMRQRSGHKFRRQHPLDSYVVDFACVEKGLIVEVDGKWLNWGGADGYSDFDWEDQWVVGCGLQYAAIPKKLYLRAGYNFGTNPVETRNGWGAGLG